MSEKKESIYQLLTQKPWEAKQAKVDDLHEGKTFNIHIGKFGLRYIMVVSTIMSVSYTHLTLPTNREV